MKPSTRLEVSIGQSKIYVDVLQKGMNTILFSACHENYWKWMIKVDEQICYRAKYRVPIKDYEWEVFNDCLEVSPDPLYTVAGLSLSFAGLPTRWFKLRELPAYEFVGGEEFDKR